MVARFGGGDLRLLFVWTVFHRDCCILVGRRGVGAVCLGRVQAITAPRTSLVSELGGGARVAPLSFLFD